MYEGNYKTRTKESVFSWDIVIGIIKELINDGKYLDAKKEELLSRIQELNTSIGYIDEKQQFYDDVLSGRRKYCSYLISVEE